MSSIDNLISLGAGPRLPEAPHNRIYDYIREVVSHEPSRTAVQGADGSLSYLDLWRAAGELRDRMHRMGCQPGDRVAVLCAPSAAMIVAVLGILLAEAAYVPVDLGLPEARIEAILTDAKIGLVVADAVGRRRQSLAAETDSNGPLSLIRRPLSEDSLSTDGVAYIIYTSGTTGEPKGVVVGHQQLCSSTLARQLIYQVPPKFLLVSPLAFDSSVGGIWGTLCSGGRLVVATGQEARDPESLVHLIENRKIEQILCIPSLYDQILGVAQQKGSSCLRSLQTVIVAGESLSEVLVEQHFRAHEGDVHLVNEYGPTEATVFASYHRFTKPGPVSIGGPIPGANLYVLDDDLRLTQMHAQGELYIGGAGVALGYFGKDQETDLAFINDPFAGGGDRKMFRTGDIVFWNEDGRLTFVGRRDQQVKIRGHRVELGAVETCLRRDPMVSDAVVLPSAGNTHLVGFVAARKLVSADALRRNLARSMDPASVPSVLHVMGKLPRTTNGKVDRRRLAQQANLESGHVPGYRDCEIPGKTELHAESRPIELVKAAWTDVLRIQSVPVDVNFFDLGGHSLAMFSLQDALEERTGFRPSIVMLFRHTTVVEQASHIFDARGGDGSPSSREGHGLNHTNCHRAGETGHD